MTDIDDVLEQCLTDIFTGDSTLEECLIRYPEHFEQLEPLLRTAIRFQPISRVKPAPEFKVHVRNRLFSHMQAHPHQKERVNTTFPFRRLMAGAIALLVTLFVTGTVYAQGVLPGDPFYNWKLNSERAWRLVSSDSVVTDLRIANRRINEMNVTVHDQARWSRALQGYNEVRSRLEVEVDSDTLEVILPPAKLFTYPDVATATPVEVTEPVTVSTLSPSETSAPEDTVEPTVAATEDMQKDMDQNDKENKEEDKEDQEKDKGKGHKETATAEPQDLLEESTPTPTEPVIIPTIEIPPPAQ